MEAIKDDRFDDKMETSIQEIKLINSQTKQRAKLRKKKRDYTIPVRLNQQSKTLNSNLIDNFNQKKLISSKCKYISSIKSATKRVSQANIMIGVTIIFFITNFAFCDKTTVTIQNSITRKPNSIQSSSTSTSTTRTPSLINRKQEAHKTKLMSALESIERQHFKMNQIKVFANKRPSKFDSGDEFTQDFQSSGTKLTNSFAHQSNDQDPMRYIVSMHQQATNQQPLGILEDESGSISKNRWKNSMKAASNLVNSNKMLSQMFSYVTPLSKETKSSLVNNENVNQHPTNSVGYDNSNYKRNNDSLINISSRLRSLVSPYVARSINSHLVSKLNSQPTFVTLPPQTSFLAKPPGDTTKEVSSQLINIDTAKDLIASDSSDSQISMALNAPLYDSKLSTSTRTTAQNKFKLNKPGQNYIQDSFRGLLTLTQLPILAGGQISTAPSVLELAKYKPTRDSTNSSLSRPTSFFALSEDQRKRLVDELYRYAYIIATGVRRKKDPLVALGTNSLQSHISPLIGFGANQKGAGLGATSSQRNQQQTARESYGKRLKTILDGSSKKAKPRGVIWDMATDPSLAVTVFHLLERANVALPLGFLLMPFVQMIRNRFSGIALSRILPPRASHRSVDYEELAKRLDVVDKMLSKALRSTHRENSFMGR